MGKIELYDSLIENLENYFNDDITGYEEELIKISLLSKYIKTLKAIKLLDINGYFEDAEMLVRSMFEILITIAYCEYHNSYLRYSNYSFVTRKKYLDKLKTKEIKVNEDIEREIIIGYEMFINEFHIHNHQLNNWNGISFKKTVEDVARNYDLDYVIMLYEAIYMIASGYIHSESLSAIQYIDLREIENNFVDYKIDAFPDNNYFKIIEDVIRLNEVFLVMFKSIKSVAKV